MENSKIQNDIDSDKAKILWTLKDGSTPMRRIYSTAKHLGSKCSYEELSKLVKSLVDNGTLIASPHPVNPAEFFYSIKLEHG